MKKLFQNVVEKTGKDERYSHQFFFKARDIIQAGDQDAIQKEKLALKFLRLTEYA